MRPVAAVDDEGDVVALLLRYRSPDGPDGCLECPVDALREALAAAPTAPIVGFVPDDVEVPDPTRLVAAAVSALGSAGVVAPRTPVTDAVKLVDGRRIVRTVDRSSLHRVHVPAFVRTEVLRRAMRDARSGTVRPLLATAAASGGQIGRLDLDEVAS